jgi:3-hydroxyisobutyrate dehydrogenase-like beta-hydroxyacid dehydrogenase
VTDAADRPVTADRAVVADRPVVGMAGTGRMGSAMARALHLAGLELVLWNRDATKAQALGDELGARVAETPAALAATADITLTMLADDDAVADVYGAADGLLAGARSGSVLVDMSTVTPGTLGRFEAVARDRGAGLLDAPVSGSTASAASGQLTIMVGGDAGDVARARPALEPLATSIFHLGPLGSGAAMKLAVNTLIFGLNEAVAEGLVLAERAGIDRVAAYQVLAASAAGAPYLGYKKAAFLDPARTPVAFSLDLAEKDLRLIAGLAASLGLSLPQAETNLAMVRTASSGGRGGDDFSSVAEELRAGVRSPIAQGATDGGEGSR